MGTTAASKNQDFKAATASDAMNFVHMGRFFTLVKIFDVQYQCTFIHYRFFVFFLYSLSIS